MSRDSPTYSVSCILHPRENVTNFCNRVECLVELCPLCVCSHSEKHERARTLPSYESIQQTLKNCENLITKQKDQIKKAQKTINDYQNDWNEKKSNVIEKLQKAKSDTIAAVTSIYDQLAKSYKSKIEEEQKFLEKQYGGKFENLAECCKNLENDLVFYQKQLTKGNSSHFIKPLYTEVLPKSEDTIKRMNRDFEKLSRNQITLEYPKQTLINDIKNLIVDSIQLQLIFYEDDEEIDEPENSTPPVPFASTNGSFVNRRMSPPGAKYSTMPTPQPYILSRMPPPDTIKQNTPLKWSNSNWKVYY